MLASTCVALPAAATASPAPAPLLAGSSMRLCPDDSAKLKTASTLSSRGGARADGSSHAPLERTGWSGVSNTPRTDTIGMLRPTLQRQVAVTSALSVASAIATESPTQRSRTSLCAPPGRSTRLSPPMHGFW
eukprot:2349080-Rhodomonas_salina.1